MVYAEIIQRFTGYYIESESKEYKYRLYITLTYGQLSCGYDVGSQTNLIIDVGVKETTEARSNAFKCNLMMPSEADQQNWGPLNSYLQHVLQTIFYSMKYQSENIYFKNAPAPPVPWILNGGPLAVQCWANVADGSPAFNRQGLGIHCLLRCCQDQSVGGKSDREMTEEGPGRRGWNRMPEGDGGIRWEA